ncbi:hypothetical protein ISO79_18390 [Morganella morganii subsp. morganii]|uniref:hypothetical protein n=1 Tax=Morganella TaxID=581 RepID=UPI0008A1EB6A|nr:MULTISPECIES: hypothetical protein [Morganella]ELB3893608.1 hypothetical protein [Morganella morganii]MBT0375681.1 hypothetical protein [Morganella morganii subsp. morganii]MBT0435136.1 hypothetical protein [Morganella morganii subsp. morganii]OFU97649.1 hypothetical protein HMPREF3119_14200 [Morganella sp. HMSC11D09]HCD1111351.1 hypothetical protein [Morganella morganii]
MLYMVQDITAFDNENGAGIVATVHVYLDDDTPLSDIRISVRLPLMKNSTLSDIEVAAIEQAKDKLQKAQ